METVVPSLGEIIDAFAVCLGGKLGVDDKAECRRVGKAYRRQLRLFGDAALRGQVEKARGREYRLTISPGARLVAYALAYQTRRRRKDWVPTTLRDLRLTSRVISPRVPTTSTVIAKSSEKSDGGHRIVCVLPLVQRAKAAMASHLILARVGYSPFEYVRKGRGRDAAAAVGLHAIKHHGVRWTALLDVKGFYPSCSREMAYSVVPISKRVIDNAIFIPKTTPIHFLNSTYQCLEPAVRSGLPEGSQASGLVAQKIMESRLSAISAPLKICHGDNVMIGHVTQDKCLATMNAFASLLEKHPDGPLSLKECQTFGLNDPLADFCGYRFRWGSNKGARVAPSRRAHRRFDRRLFAQMFLCPADDEGLIQKYARGWAGSFGLWKGREFHAVNVEISAMAWLAPLAAKARKEFAGAVVKDFKDLGLLSRKVATECIPSSVSWCGH